MKDIVLDLAKAHSVKTHLHNMNKAVNSFHEKMTKLHAAHHADMSEAMGQLHKMVGIEPSEASEFGGGGNEPKSIDLKTEGTTNLQTFPGTNSSDAAKTATDNLKKAGMNDLEIELILAKRAEAAEATRPVTIADLQKLINANNEGLIKAFFEAGVDPTNIGDSSNSNNGYVPTTYAKGIGDRTNPAPVQQAPTNEMTKGAGEGDKPLHKAAPGVVDPVLTPEFANQVLNNGSVEDKLAFMKSARPVALPDTLVSPLSKIH